MAKRKPAEDYQYNRFTVSDPASLAKHIQQFLGKSFSETDFGNGKHYNEWYELSADMKIDKEFKLTVEKWQLDYADNAITSFGICNYIKYLLVKIIESTGPLGRISRNRLVTMGIDKLPFYPDDVYVRADSSGVEGSYWKTCVNRKVENLLEEGFIEKLPGIDKKNPIYRLVNRDFSSLLPKAA